MNNKARVSRLSFRFSWLWCNIVTNTSEIERSKEYFNSQYTKVISIETSCLRTEGTLSVPFNSNGDVEQKFYFCLSKIFVADDQPCSTNVRIFSAVHLVFEEDFKNSDEIMQILENCVIYLSYCPYIVYKYLARSKSRQNPATLCMQQLISKQFVILSKVILKFWFP